MSRILIALIEKLSMVAFIHHAVGKAQFSVCSLKQRSPTLGPWCAAGLQPNGNWPVQAVGECATVQSCIYTSGMRICKTIPSPFCCRQSAEPDRMGTIGLKDRYSFMQMIRKKAQGIICLVFEDKV